MRESLESHLFWNLLYETRHQEKQFLSVIIFTFSSSSSFKLSVSSPSSPSSSSPMPEVYFQISVSQWSSWIWALNAVKIADQMELVTVWQYAAIATIMDRNNRFRRNTSSSTWWVTTFDDHDLSERHELMVIRPWHDLLTLCCAKYLVSQRASKTLSQQLLCIPRLSGPRAIRLDDLLGDAKIWEERKFGCERPFNWNESF